jgi:hypothetical protein
VAYQVAEKASTAARLHDAFCLAAEAEMRGSEVRSSGPFPYIRLKDRIAADRALRSDPKFGGQGACGLVGRFAHFMHARSHFDPALSVDVGNLAASVLHGALRATVDGASQRADHRCYSNGTVSKLVK